MKGRRIQKRVVIDGLKVRLTYPLILRFIEILDEFIDLMLDIRNSEPFEEDFPERAVRNIESRVGSRSFMIRRSLWEYWLGCVAIGVGLVAKRSLLDRVHFEL